MYILLTRNSSLLFHLFILFIYHLFLILHVCIMYVNVHDMNEWKSATRHMCVCLIFTSHLPVCPGTQSQIARLV